MKSLTLQDLASVQSNVMTWAVCWMVTDKLGGVIRQTSHDRNISVSRTVNSINLSGTYQSILGMQASTVKQSADQSVDNLDIEALLNENGITAADIRAGIFDNVEFTIFLVNWADPTNSGIVVKHGLVGNIRSFANDLATGEGRGLKQFLQQSIVEAYGLTCRAKLGDDRCTVDLAALSYDGAVGTVVSRRMFTATLTGASEDPAPGYFQGGILRFTSGDNVGFEQEVKLDESDTDGVWTFTIFEPFPNPVQASDVFEVEPGCNHLHQKINGVWQGDCLDKFDNIVNMRAEPMIPGTAEMLRGAQ